jgi:DNA-binding SARP family transcriptional activator
LLLLFPFLLTLMVLGTVVYDARDLHTSQVSLRLLGGFELMMADGLAVLPLTEARLAAFVALREGPTPRQLAANSLWADGTEARAAGCLRSALWRVRLLGAPLIIAKNDYLYVAPSVQVDVREARSFATSLTQETTSFDPATARGLLARDVLPHWYDEWLLLEQEQFRTLRLHALEIAAVRLAERDLFLQALEMGLAAVAADPLRESAHRTIMRIHLMEGNYSEALREFNLYAEVARRDLGVEPSPEMEGLLDRGQRRPAPSRARKNIFTGDKGVAL